MALPRMPMAAALSAAYLASILFPAALRRLYVIRDDNLEPHHAASPILELNCGHYSLSLPPNAIWAGLSVLRCCPAVSDQCFDQAPDLCLPSPSGASQLFGQISG